MCYDASNNLIILLLYMIIKEKSEMRNYYGYDYDTEDSGCTCRSSLC